MEQSAFNTLIQNLYQLKSSLSSNELANRLQVQNYFSLPFALAHDMSPVQAGLERQKGYFKMDSNTGILEMYLSDFITLAILPDKNTFYRFSNQSLILVVDVPSYQLEVYLPRVNNYTKKMSIDCSNRSDAIESLRSLSELIERLKKMSSETKEQKSRQVLMLQLSAESQASKNYNHQGQKYEFCKTLVQQVNDLLSNNDEDFINFISQKIAEHFGNKSVKNVKSIIKKALNSQDEEMRYYFVPGNQHDFEKMLMKMPLFSSPCTLKPEKKTLGYIDSSHQLQSPDMIDNDGQIQSQSDKKSKNNVNVDDVNTSDDIDLFPDNKNSNDERNFSDDEEQKENKSIKGKINADVKETEEPTVQNFFNLNSSDETEDTQEEGGDDYDGNVFDD